MLNKSQTNKLRMTASISFNEFENWAEDEVVPKSEFPMAQIIETLDGRICPLCRQRHGRLIDRTGEDWRRHGQQAHINCRVRFAYINKAERGPDGGPIAPDFTPPSKPLIDRHGHFIKEPKKFEPLRVPPFADGREFIVKRIIDPKTGEAKTALLWNFQQRLIPGLWETRTLHMTRKDVSQVVGHLKETGQTTLATEFEKTAEKTFEKSGITDFDSFTNMAVETMGVIKSKFGLTEAKNLWNGRLFKHRKKALGMAYWNGDIGLRKSVIDGLEKMWQRKALTDHAIETGLTEAVAAKMSVSDLQKHLWLSPGSSETRKEIIRALHTMNHEQWHHLAVAKGEKQYRGIAGKVWEEGCTELTAQNTMKEYIESLIGFKPAEWRPTYHMYPRQSAVVRGLLEKTGRKFGTEPYRKGLIELKSEIHAGLRSEKMTEWLMETGMTKREAEKAIREAFKAERFTRWKMKMGRTKED